MSEPEVSATKALKEKARKAKQGIADWLSEFEAKNGRAPTAEEKAPIQHLFDTFKRASAQLKELKSATPQKKKKKKKKKEQDEEEPGQEPPQGPPPEQQQQQQPEASPAPKESPPPLVRTPTVPDEPAAEASAVSEPLPASNEEEQPAGVAMAQDEPAAPTVPATAAVEAADEDVQAASGDEVISPSPAAADAAAQEDGAPPPPAEEAEARTPEEPAAESATTEEVAAAGEAAVDEEDSSGAVANVESSDVVFPANASEAEATTGDQAEPTMEGIPAEAAVAEEQQQEGAADDDASSVHSLLTFDGHELHPETPAAQAFFGHLADHMNNTHATNDAFSDGTGWSQRVDDDGNLFWYHHETGEGRFVLDMSDELEDLDEIERLEGLGENYLETPWVPPNVDRAKKRAMEVIFEGGSAPLLSTHISELRDFDRDTWLYFVFVKGASMAFLIMTIAYLPTISLCFYGEGAASPDVLQQSVGFFRVSVGNIGTEGDSRAYQEPLRWLMQDVEKKRTGFFLGLITVLATVISLFAWARFRAFNIPEAEESNDHPTCSMYSVFVTNTAGLSLDAVMTHVRDKLVAMEKEDGEDGIVDIVEAVPVYADSEGIREFLKHQKKRKKVRRYRAQVKMYSEGAMANEDKRKKAEDHLEWHEYFFDHHMAKLERHHVKHHEAVDAVAASAAQGSSDSQRGGNQMQSQPLVGVFIVFDESGSVDRCLESFADGTQQDVGKAAAAAAAKELWLQLDADGDGDVSYEEFATGFKQKMGRLMPPSRVVKKMYKTAKAAAAADGDIGDEGGIGSRKLVVERAPVPENVLWENMRMLAKPKQIVCNRITTQLLLLLLLIILCVVAAFISSFVIPGTDSDLRMCALHLPVTLIGGASDVGVGCGEIRKDMSWMRPGPNSEKRKTWDEYCDTAWPGSTFLVLNRESGGYANYLSESDVAYADVTDPNALAAACYSDRCPRAAVAQCPCVKMKPGRLGSCGMDHIDAVTCEAVVDDDSGDKAVLPMHKSDAASCYCYFDVIEPLVKERGVLSGLRKSLELSSDLCKGMVWHSVSLLRSNMFIAAFIVAISVLLHKLLPKMVEKEGHIFEDSKLKQNFFVLWRGQLVGTVLIPLVVHGDADRAAVETWREWIDTLLFDTATRNGQLVYILYAILLLDTAIPVVRYWRYLARQRAVERSGVGEKSSTVMQLDLDAIYYGKPFNLVQQYVSALCLIYLTNIMGPGLPLLFPLTAAALAIKYWTSKFLIFRFHRKPSFKSAGGLFHFAVRLWAYGIVLHLLSAWYTYGNREVSRRIRESNVPFVEDQYECTMPLFLGLFLAMSVFYFLPNEDLTMEGSDNKWSEARQAWVPKQPIHGSLFTGPFESLSSAGGSHELSSHDYRRGWRVDSDRGAKYKVRPGNRKLKTWEVIEDHGLHSYRRSENPRYREAIHAIKKRLPKGHALLMADTAPKSPEETARMLAEEEERQRQLAEEIKAEQERQSLSAADGAMRRSAKIHPFSSIVFGADEGLGEDFRDSDWVQPDPKLALEANQLKQFKEGKASVWGTAVDEFSEMGTGVMAYFYILSSCTKMFLISAILSVPHMVMAHYGNYGDVEDTAGGDSKSMSWRLFAHSAGHHAYVPPKNVQNQMCGDDISVDTIFMDDVDCTAEWLYRIPPLKLIFDNDLIRAKDASAVVAFLDLFNSLFIFFSILWMKRRLRKKIAVHSRNACEVSSFSVFVRGLPRDADEKEVIAHFSNLYKLDVKDWEHPGTFCGIGRKLARTPDDIVFPSGIKGEKLLQPVAAGAAQNALKPELYDGTWVAEVCIVHPLGDFIRTLRSKSKLSRRLLEDRARIKKWSDATSTESTLFSSREALKRDAEKQYARTSKRIARSKKDLENHHRVLEDAEHKCTGAFVVFNHEESVKRCLADYSKKNFLTRCCFGQHKALRFRGEYTLRVTPADKPGNIIWENINIGKGELRIRKCVALAVTFCGLAISFVIILFASLASQTLQENMPTNDMCVKQIPSVYGVPSTASPEWLTDSSKCGDKSGSHYITFTEAAAAYRDESWSGDCTAPCVDEEDTKQHTCLAYGGTEEYEYSPSQVLSCYCLDRIIEKISDHGFYKGPRQMAKDDICGNYAKDFVQVQSLTLVVNIMIPVVNELLKAAIQSLGKFRRNKTTTEKSISIAINTFYALFINTAILLLVINGKMRLYYLGFTLNGHNELASRDYDETWYTQTGLAIANILVTNIVIPQLPYVLAPVNKYFQRLFSGRGLTQFHLNEVYQSEPFQVEQRFSQLLFTLACTLAFSSALPLLYLIGFVALALSYWCDKYLLLRYFKRPTLIEGQLGKQVLNVLPMLLMLHCINATWVYAYRPSQGYHGEVDNMNPELDGVDGNIGGVFDAYLYTNSAENFYNLYSKHRIIGPLFLRLNRLHVLPIFLLFVVMFSWYFILSKFLHVFIELLTKCGLCSAQDAGKALAAMRQFNPTFTEEYRKMVPDKWSYRKNKFVPRSRPHLSAKEGWHFSDPDEMGHTYYYKTRHAQSGRPKKENMKTWEVVQASGLHSFEVRLNEAYKEVFIAKDALIKAEERQELFLPKETHGEPTVEGPDEQPMAKAQEEKVGIGLVEGAAGGEEAPFDQEDRSADLNSKCEPPEATTLGNEGSAVNEEPSNQPPAASEGVEKEEGDAEEGVENPSPEQQQEGEEEEEEEASPAPKESPPPLVRTPTVPDEPAAEASAVSEPLPASNEEEQPAGVAMAQDEPAAPTVPATAAVEAADEDVQAASGDEVISPSPAAADAAAQEDGAPSRPLSRSGSEEAEGIEAYLAARRLAGSHDEDES